MLLYAGGWMMPIGVLMGVSGLLGWLPIVANSAVWAAGICYVFHRIRSRRLEKTNGG